MTGRRTAHTYRAHVDTRDEVPQTPCLMRPEAFDVLLDCVSGPWHREAVTEVEEMCLTCPIQLTCHADAESQGEEWMRSLRRGQRAAQRAENRVVVQPQEPEVMPEELRRHHATFTRLKAKREEIPPSIRDGERGYQTFIKRQSRARAGVAA